MKRTTRPVFAAALALLCAALTGCGPAAEPPKPAAERPTLGGDATPEEEIRFAEGLAAWEERDPYTAWEKWLPLADGGHPVAQYRLALMTVKGQGIDADETRAFEWMLRAAEGGHFKAQNNVGAMYLGGKGVDADPQAAYEWFLRAGMQGHRNAQYNLGSVLMNGSGRERDPVGAYMWLSLAAEQGLDRAAMRLEELGPTMAAEQIAEAKRRAREWAPHTAP